MRIQYGGTIQKKFTAALDHLVEQVKKDRSILAAILCGSLSHDTVWAKSDIDLALITIDDKKVETAHIGLYAEGMNVHAFLMRRAEFRKTVEGAVRNSFMHSLLAKGRCFTPTMRPSRISAPDCTKLASATRRCNCSPPRHTRWLL